MKILVTGGAGFIGSHITDKLIEKGDQVAIVDNLSTGKKGNINPQAVFYNTDIRDKEALKDVFAKEKPEIVFHEAAEIDVRASVKDPVFNAGINILGSLNLLELAKEFEIKKFVFASTGGAIYGDADIVPTPESYSARPISPYGVSKLAIEEYLYYYGEIFNLPSVILRYANVYGPRQDPLGEAGVVGIFINKLLKGKQAVINGDGSQTRDFVYVKDVVEANISAIDNNKTGIFNIGTGVEISVNKLFQTLKEITKSDIQEFHAPAKKGEQQRSCLDFSKIEKELNWQPKYTLEDGLKETIEWFKS